MCCQQTVASRCWYTLSWMIKRPPTAEGQSASQVQIFVSSAPQKSPLRDGGLWIQSTLVLLGLTTSPCSAGEGVCRGFRETQTISRAFRQKHCAGLSSRGCLTSSSSFKVLLGLICCQMTCCAAGCRDVRTIPTSDCFSSVIFSVFLLFQDQVLYFFADPFLSTSSPTVSRTVHRESDLFAWAAGRGRNDHKNNCRSSNSTFFFQEKNEFPIS